MPAWMTQFITYSSVLGLVGVAVGILSFVWGASRNGLIDADRRLNKSLSDENAHLIKKTNYLERVIDRYNTIIDDHQRQLNNISMEIRTINTILGGLKNVSNPTRSNHSTTTSNRVTNAGSELPLPTPTSAPTPTRRRPDSGMGNLDAILEESS